MKTPYHNLPRLSLDGIKFDANYFQKEKSEADFKLGVLQGSHRRLFNPELLISPLVAKEATVSSRIEGTISSVADVFMYEAGEKPKYEGTAEVANYRRAMRYAIKQIESGGSIKKTLLKEIHKILLEGVRHQGTLGSFRSEDVWIGEKRTDPIEKAIYVPPFHVTVDSYIENLLQYLLEGKEDALTKAAIIHYQFEAIHPFEDGNGRIGRLLIPLILYQAKKLSVPILYLSGHFDENKDGYLEALHGVDKTGELEPWLKFFFESVSRQADQTEGLIESIYSLYDNLRGDSKNSTSPYIIPFLEYIFETPVFTVTKLQERIGATYITSARLIREFQERGVLQEAQAKDDKRVKLYKFSPLLNALK